MQNRSLLAAALLILPGSLLLGALDQPPKPVAARSDRPVLPGAQPGGAIQLPNQWSLRPVGRQVKVGDFPVNIALHPSGEWIAILHAGYRDHEIIIVDLKSARIACRVLIDQTFYGLTLVPTAEALRQRRRVRGRPCVPLRRRAAFQHREIPVAERKDKFIVRRHGHGRRRFHLVRRRTLGRRRRRRAAGRPREARHYPFARESYPYACLPDPGGKRLFVSLWNKAAVAVIDLASQKVIATWPTEKHPTEMALSPDGKTLYVACANSTRVSVLDAGHRQGPGNHQLRSVSQLPRTATRPTACA